ncbi:hypothetical protein CCACVL1_25581 [Corchorus capsularis]|uniref:Uncharacterized protein n=1 Tax=Corchorus capsularis TaxID=210143 RepID=A0A1R3GJB4_COCAP|nr:hypothetical protein CCACVL1_25581 [Corchorus capsularis]
MVLWAPQRHVADYLWPFWKWHAILGDSEDMESDDDVRDVEGEGSVDEQEEGVRHASDGEDTGESSDEIDDEDGEEDSHVGTEDDAFGVSDVEDNRASEPICNRKVASRAAATNIYVLPFLEKYNKKCKSTFSVAGGFFSKYSCNGPNVVRSSQTATKKVACKAGLSGTSELSDGGVPLEIEVAARRHGRGKGPMGLVGMRHVTNVEAATHPPSEEEHFDGPEINPDW